MWAELNTEIFLPDENLKDFYLARIWRIWAPLSQPAPAPKHLQIKMTVEGGGGESDGGVYRNLEMIMVEMTKIIVVILRCRPLFRLQVLPKSVLCPENFPLLRKRMICPRGLLSGEMTIGFGKKCQLTPFAKVWTLSRKISFSKLWNFSRKIPFSKVWRSSSVKKRDVVALKPLSRQFFC